MHKDMDRDNGGRLYFPVHGVLESGMSYSRVNYAKRYCEGGGDENNQRDGWKRSEGALQ